MEMDELLKLYHEFFKTLKKKVNEDCYPEKMKAATQKKVDKLAADFNLFIPDDIRAFLCTPKTVYTMARFEDNEEWEAGFEFCDIEEMSSEIPMYRDDLAPNYKDGDPLKRLHLRGVPLSSEEPALIFDADPSSENHGIYLMLWDGEPSSKPIAPDFTTFLTHWLASGCFAGREFKKYWKVVKDFVPINIPVKENLWLNYYSILYKGQYKVF